MHLFSFILHYCKIFLLSLYKIKNKVMEISEEKYNEMQATIKDLQAYKDSHAKAEEEEIKKYMEQRDKDRKLSTQIIESNKQRLV